MCASRSFATLPTSWQRSLGRNGVVLIYLFLGFITELPERRSKLGKSGSEPPNLIRLSH